MTSGLDAAAIARLVPHAGRMCLLERVTGWTPDSVDATASSHRGAGHPLRSASGLLAPCAIEYAAQAMALHGALRAGDGGAPRPGLLASVRGVRFGVDRLDTIGADLRIHVERLAGDERQVSYAFRVAVDGTGQLVAEGRATVLMGVQA